MQKPLLRTDKEIADIYSRHAKTVYRVCFSFMKNTEETEDALQETFFRLIGKGPAFASEEHEKAWLIRTASNVCKNMLKHWWRKRENLEDHSDIATDQTFPDDTCMNAILSLPEKLKTVVYLYYYEGYTSVEIAKILGKPQSTVRYLLSEARGILKERLGEDFEE